MIYASIRPYAAHSTSISPQYPHQVDEPSINPDVGEGNSISYGIEFSLDPTDDGSGVPDCFEDPDILASLVIQLCTNFQTTRTELSHIKDEREELITALAIALTKISDLKFEKEDMHKAMTDLKDLNGSERIRAEGLVKDLGEALRKVQEGEDAITMLRSKVKESRRGRGLCAYNQSRADA